MELDLTRLNSLAFMDFTGKKEAPKKPSETLKGEGEYKTPIEVKKPLETLTEGLEGINKLQREAELRAKEAEEHAAAAKQEKEQAEQAYKHLAENHKGLLSEVEKLRADLKAARERIGTVSEQEKSKIKAELEAEYKKKLAAEYEVKIAKLEAELKAKAAKYETANDIEVQKFAVHFENFQNEFNALAGSLNNLRERDGNTSAKLLAGLRRVLEQMRETLGD